MSEFDLEAIKKAQHDRYLESSDHKIQQIEAQLTEKDREIENYRGTGLALLSYKNQLQQTKALLDEATEVIGLLAGFSQSKIQFPHKDCPELISSIEKSREFLAKVKGERDNQG